MPILTWVLMVETLKKVILKSLLEMEPLSKHSPYLLINKPRIKKTDARS